LKAEESIRTTRTREKVSKTMASSLKARSGIKVIHLLRDTIRQLGKVQKQMISMKAVVVDSNSRTLCIIATRIFSDRTNTSREEEDKTNQMGRWIKVRWFQRCFHSSRIYSRKITEK